MKYYFAPMEGITWYVYRNLQAKYFKPADVYMTPFISPNHKREMRSREKNDILPENNKGLKIIPQIIGNKADEFIDTALQLKEFGYSEVNLNLGCPSGTVVAKGKGAGFLSNLDNLEAFLDEIYSGLNMDISIKTRIGRFDVEEVYDIISLYNKYPVKELIIHPRTQKEMYSGLPHMEHFSYALKESANPVCYNGNLYTKEDVDRTFQMYQGDEYNKLGSLMFGRGIISNPALIEEVTGEGVLDKRRLKLFVDEIKGEYQLLLSGDIPVLNRMKALWHYMICNFTNADRFSKKIRKAKNLKEYELIIEELFKEDLLPNPPKTF